MSQSVQPISVMSHFGENLHKLVFAASKSENHLNLSQYFYVINDYAARREAVFCAADAVFSTMDDYEIVYLFIEKSLKQLSEIDQKTKILLILPPFLNDFVDRSFIVNCWLSLQTQPHRLLIHDAIPIVELLHLICHDNECVVGGFTSCHLQSIKRSLNSADLMTEFNSDGRALGEVLVWLKFSRSVPSALCVIGFKQVDVTSIMAFTDKVKIYIDSFKQLLNQHHVTVDAIKCLLYLGSPLLHDVVMFYYFKQHFWPDCTMMPKIISTHCILGDCQSYNALIQLALAYHFAEQLQQKQVILILDDYQHDKLGMVLLMKKEVVVC